MSCRDAGASFMPRSTTRVKLGQQPGPRERPVFSVGSRVRAAASLRGRPGGYQNVERDDRVLERDRGDHQDVEDLVVAEEGRQRIGSAQRVDDRAHRVRDAAGEQQREAEAPIA